MGDRTGIEWTDATWNPVAGCTRVSAGCDNCYAARAVATRMRDTRSHGGLAVITPSGRAAFTGKIRLLPERLDQPLRWRKPRRIFVNSMSDLFHENVPFEFVAKVFDVMCDERAQQHTFQVLTKRPKRIPKFFDWYEGAGDRPLSIALEVCGHAGDNVWLGTSVENQETADERIPELLATPAAVRFLSCEPLLGPIDLSRWLPIAPRGEQWERVKIEAAYEEPKRPAIDWLVVGGESGPNARPMDLAWARAIVEQCRAACVPVFVKQIGRQPYVRPEPQRTLCDGSYQRIDWIVRDLKGGNPREWPEDLRIREWPTCV